MHDLNAWFQSGNDIIYNPKTRSLGYWPVDGYRTDINILIVGSNDYESAAIAYSNPAAQVTVIDSDKQNLQASNQLKESYQLDNLMLIEQNIHDLNDSSSCYDFISICSALNSFDEPFAILAKLSEHLSSNGVLCGMLPAKYGPAALQELSSALLNTSLYESDAGQDILIETINALPENSPCNRFLQRKGKSQILQEPFAFFQNEAARGYAVGELFDGFSAANLHFHSWLFNGQYEPGLFFSKQSELYHKIQSLPDRDKFAAIELVNGAIDNHYFILSKEDHAKAQSQINFNAIDIMSCVPKTRINNIRKITTEGIDKVAVREAPQPEVFLDAMQIKIVEQIDGVKTVSECFNCAQVKGADKDIANSARLFFESLWRSGLIYINTLPAKSHK